MRYAANTTVAVERSRAEIESVLGRYGATRFGYMTDERGAIVGFGAHNRRLRFVVPLPSRDDEEFTRTPARHSRRSEDEAYRLWEQACRQRWRALALAIKAKLEAAVESGISEFESEFLAHIVMSDGQTVGDWARPQIEQMYQSKRMPPLLLESRR